MRIGLDTNAPDRSRAAGARAMGRMTGYAVKYPGKLAIMTKMCFLHENFLTFVTGKLIMYENVNRLQRGCSECVEQWGSVRRILFYHALSCCEVLPRYHDKTLGGGCVLSFLKDDKQAQQLCYLLHYICCVAGIYRIIKREMAPASAGGEESTESAGVRSPA